LRRIAVAVPLMLALSLPAAAASKVLRVGSYHGIRGQYKTIQAAIKAAKPGDWVLVGPGDYKTPASATQVVTGEGQYQNGAKFPVAVLIKTPRLRLRGMNRNRVIVDGTTAGPPCNNIKADQNFGPKDSSGTPMGLNGIMVYEANNVWVQNLTACNFLSGSGGAGNEIWWNGGANGGGASTPSIHGWGFLGSYLTATTQFFDSTASNPEATAAAYGIFSSNWSGGTWIHTYSSNFNDSDYYIGACSQQCNQTVNDAWGEYSALGYSGSNSGGRMLIENSRFDNNEDGFDTNSQNGDNPPPQDGACPAGVKPPITGAPSCWVFYKNHVYDNNNPNIPSAGSAAAGPVGTGMSISGGRDDTVMDNTFYDNNAWGVIFVPYPDSGPPCTGGVGGAAPGATCWYDDWGNALLDNTFYGNGGYKNPTNGDFAEITTYPGHPQNCYRGNKDTSGPLTSSPSNLQQTNSQCGQTASQPDPNPAFTNQVLCDSQIVSGTPCVGASYPRRTQVVMHPLPPAAELPTMPNPCAGVPANPWCPAGAASKHKQKRRHKHKQKHKQK
jgi:hypothetical protein